MWCFVTDESLDWGEIANVELEKYKAYSGGMQEFFDREGGGAKKFFFFFLILNEMGNIFSHINSWAAVKQ